MQIKIHDLNPIKNWLFSGSLLYFDFMINYRLSIIPLFKNGFEKENNIIKQFAPNGHKQKTTDNMIF